MHATLPRFLFALLLSMLAATAAAVTKVTVVGLFKDTAIVVIDGTRQLLRSGDTSPEGVTLVSADSKEAVLEIDGEQKRYGLGGQIGGTYKKPDQVTVRIINRFEVIKIRHNYAQR